MESRRYSLQILIIEFGIVFFDFGGIYYKKEYYVCVYDYMFTQ
jgi:hypothetical protein